MWFDTWAAIATAVATAAALFRVFGLPLKTLIKPVGCFFTISLTVPAVVAGGWVPPFSYGRMLVAELAVIIAWYVFVMRARWFQRQALLVTDPAQRDKVLARVEERLRNLVGTPKEMSADVRAGALVFLAGGVPQRAAELLRTADVSDLMGEELSLHFAHLAMAELASGDADRALEALDSIVTPPQDDDTATRLAATRALALAVTGSSGEALSILDGGASAHPSAPLTRAHAFAAKGDLGAARSELERVLGGNGGRAMLAAVVRHRGPASPVAQSLLDGPGTPYR
jgi:hypothetical protein